jgi:hypothetical protein
MAGECVIGALLITGLTWIMARFGALLQFLVPWNRVADTGSDIAPHLLRGFAITRTVPRPIISGLSDFETELLGTGSKIDSLGAPPHRAPRGVCYPSEVRDFSTARRIYF